MWSKATTSKGNENKDICTFNNNEDVTAQFKILKYSYVNYKILINYIRIVIILPILLLLLMLSILSTSLNNYSIYTIAIIIDFIQYSCFVGYVFPFFFSFSFLDKVEELVKKENIV